MVQYSKSRSLFAQPVFDNIFGGKPFASCNDVGPYFGAIAFGDIFTFTYMIHVAAMVVNKFTIPQMHYSGCRM